MRNQTIITVQGNVVSDPVQRETDDGLHITNFRLASTDRRWSRAERTFVDADTTWYSVSCFRALAQNVAESLRKGDPVLVLGKLSTRNWEKDGRTGTAVEVEAFAVGPDLGLGTASFTRVRRSQVVVPPGRQEADELMAEAEAAGELADDLDREDVARALA